MTKKRLKAPFSSKDIQNDSCYEIQFKYPNEELWRIHTEYKATTVPECVVIKFNDLKKNMSHLSWRLILSKKEEFKEEYEFWEL